MVSLNDRSSRAKTYSFLHFRLYNATAYRPTHRAQGDNYPYSRIINLGYGVHK